MKEATGEVSMTMITIVAVAVIGGILALMWNPIQNWITSAFGGAATETGDGRYEPPEFQVPEQ